jgi:DNA-binding NarL/FixJ family response regulator
MGDITAILVDDEKIALNRMADILKHFPHVNIISKESEPETAIERIVKTKPDVVFFDVEMLSMPGFNLVQKVRDNFVFPSFIFVNAFKQYAIKALKAEAFDYLIKPIDIDDLHECLERFDRKRNHFPHIENSNLSEREKEVARLICKGLTSKKIAEILFLSKHTVDTHRRKIISKLKLISTDDFNKLDQNLRN